MKEAKRVIDKLDISPSKEELKIVKAKATEFLVALKKELLKRGIKAEVFAGGSYAKGTLYKSESYEIDVFIRFDWKYDNLSDMTEKALRGFRKEVQRVHGSRDYFKTNDGIVNFEIVPVYNIKHPKEARNVTDLSYFHVNYVKRKAKNERIKTEIRIAKAFCKAQGVYGAESYVKGFSGYALECLIIRYGSFLKMIDSLSKSEGKVLIDIEKKYKGKDALIQMNESRTQSPIVLVDPTWKERNVLAALNEETFQRFKVAARAFLKKPSQEFFIKKEISPVKLRESASKKGLEYVEVELETDRQEGDIAGTKMKKFADYLRGEISKQYDIKSYLFEYNSGKKANLHLMLKSKGEIIRIGPPIALEKACHEFKKKNKRVFVKNGILHAMTDVRLSGKDFVERFKVLNNKKVSEMAIIGLRATN